MSKSPQIVSNRLDLCCMPFDSFPPWTPLWTLLHNSDSFLRFVSSVGWTFEEMALMNVSSNYSVAKLHKKPVKWCPQKSKKGGQKWFSLFWIWASFCDSSNSLFAHFVTSDLPQRCWHICNNYVELARPHECCKMTHKTETCHLCRFAKVHFRDTDKARKVPFWSTNLANWCSTFGSLSVSHLILSFVPFASCYFYLLQC